MSLPDDVLDATLQQIILDSRHPTRKLAATRIRERRERAAEWVSDAEREGWGTATAHDDKGAPLLRVDTVLAHDHHERRLGRK